MQTNTTLTEDNPSKGILICLVSFFFVSLVGVCEKSISSAIHLPVILFVQNVICLLLTLVNVIKSDKLSFKTEHSGTYIIRILCGMGSYATLFYIIKFIPISEALLYQYSASLWVPFVMLFWLNVRMDKKLWWGIIIGFIGILFILKPTSSVFSLIALVGILCSILQAVSVVAVRKLSRTEPIMRIFFYYFLTGTLLLSPLAIKDWSPIGMEDGLLLLGVGVSTYLAQQFVTLSLKYADPITLAPICYVSLLYSGLFGWLFWHEIPDHTALLGMTLVICGCVLSMLMSQSSDEPEIPLEYEKS